MGKRVLIVDDEEMIRRFLKVHLTKWGYEVREAVDGSKALEALGDDHFDLLICDIMMPNKDGWHLLREVKSNPNTKHVTVILLTARNEEADMAKGYQLGADYYITKPFTKAQLLQGLKAVYGKG
jgi:DNA-binding response OmpR family regulator